MALTFLIIAGLAGIFAHWYNRYYQERTDKDLWCYLFKCHQRDTIYMSLAVIVSEIYFNRTLPPDIDVWSKPFFDTCLDQAATAFISDAMLNNDGSGKGTFVSKIFDKLKAVIMPSNKSRDEALEEDENL